MQTHIKLYNQSVRIESRDPTLIKYLEAFLQKFYTVTQKGFGKQEGTERLFASKLKGKPVWYLHRNQFAHFIHQLNIQNTPLTSFAYSKEDFRDYKVIKENYAIRDNWVLRDEQIPVNEFLKTKPEKSKLIPLVTGSGKSLISLYAIGELKQRMGMIIQSQFIEKWVSDIATIHVAKTKDVMVISGSKAVASIIQMAKEGEVPYSYYIFSSRTMQDYITMYENEPELCVEMYGCEPVELFALLGIGILLVDETHMAFHAVYKAIIHTNVKYQIGLSATLITDDTVISRTHKVVYPTCDTYGDNMLKKYMDVYAIAYTLSPNLMRNIKTTNYGSTYYSHTAFEQSIMKQKYYLDSYYRIVKTTIEDYYTEYFMENDKLVVFVATIALATIFTERLAKDYPSKKVVRYCEEDDYDEMLTGDFIISTPQSLSTGIDIPHLRVAIQTVSIASAVTNLQSAGRLRYLKDRDVKFCYLYCQNIPKHNQYHLARVELFKNRAASYSYHRSRVNFG